MQKEVTPSAALLANGAHANRDALAYAAIPHEVVQLLTDIVEKYYPVEYERLVAAAKDHRLVATKSFMLGVVTIWKLQVRAHLDRSDFALCIITCAGDFEGGELMFPDLGVCVRYVSPPFLFKLCLSHQNSYRPGDVIAFRSRYLYHAVRQWYPAKQKNDLTPGRVSWVFFTHKIAIEQTELNTAKLAEELERLIQLKAHKRPRRK